MPQGFESLVLGRIDADVYKSMLVGKRILDEIYKMYIYASLGEKNRIENEIMKMFTKAARVTYVFSIFSNFWLIFGTL